jgi:hypothetical protein
MNVYTYFEPLNLNDAKELIPLWVGAWKRVGCTPLVLLPSDATQADDYHEFVARVSTYPTVNPPAYELACYVRWLALREAMDRQSGIVSMMVDLDVLPRFQRPRPEWLTDVVFHDAARVPCAVEVMRSGAGQIVDFLTKRAPAISQHDGRPHTSDMICLQQAPWPSTGLCREYGSEGWEASPLVHFASSRMDGRRKSEVVREFVSSLL